VTRRQKAIAFFVTLCVLLVAAAVALNIGWIVINSSRLAPLILGIVSFALIIAGLIVYTVFLVLEIKRNEDHDTFINAVTHELKTPIASMRLYLQTLQSRDIDESRRQEFYAIMLADADRLHRTVEQVLAAGASGQKANAVVRTPVDVAAMAGDCVQLAVVRHHLDASAITLETPDGNPGVSGDAEQLATVVTNLLDNAVKYTPAGGTVSIMARRGEAGPEIVVADSGPGIPPDFREKALRRFTRLEASRQAPGSGLGLSLVAAVAELHDAALDLEDNGPGLRVVMRFTPGSGPYPT